MKHRTGQMVTWQATRHKWRGHVWTLVPPGIMPADVMALIGRKPFWNGFRLRFNAGRVTNTERYLIAALNGDKRPTLFLKSAKSLVAVDDTPPSKPPAPPITVARLILTATDFQWEVRCPYCLRVHSHHAGGLGATAKQIRASLSHREAGCKARTYTQRDLASMGYILVAPNSEVKP